MPSGFLQRERQALHGLVLALHADLRFYLQGATCTTDERIIVNLA